MALVERAVKAHEVGEQVSAEFGGGAFGDAGQDDAVAHRGDGAGKEDGNDDGADFPHGRPVARDKDAVEHGLHLAGEDREAAAFDGHEEEGDKEERPVAAQVGAPEPEEQAVAGRGHL